MDQFRHGIEKMDPAEYLISNYYEHGVHTVEHYAEAAGVPDPAELEARTWHYLENPDAPSARVWTHGVRVGRGPTASTPQAVSTIPGGGRTPQPTRWHPCSCTSSDC